MNGKPDVYMNARGETVMTYEVFKALAVESVMRAITRR